LKIRWMLVGILLPVMTPPIQAQAAIGEALGLVSVPEIRLYGLEAGFLLLPFGKRQADSKTLNALESNVRGYLSLSNLSCDTEVWRIERAMSNAPREIREALRAMGYYNPDISRLKWEETRQCWTVSVNIDPGVPVIIDSVNVEITGEGRDNRALTGTVKKIPLHVGDIVHHGKYEQAKKQLHSILTAQGYLEATWTVHKLVVNPETNRARVLLGMDTGPRYTYGALSWDPMPLEDDLVQRMLDIPRGGDYNNKSLQYMQRNILPCSRKTSSTPKCTRWTDRGIWMASSISGRWNISPPSWTIGTSSGVCVPSSGDAGKRTVSVLAQTRSNCRCPFSNRPACQSSSNSPALTLPPGKVHWKSRIPRCPRSLPSTSPAVAEPGSMASPQCTSLREPDSVMPMARTVPKSTVTSMRARASDSNDHRIALTTPPLCRNAIARSGPDHPGEKPDQT
jgi:hypothetical protein